MLKDKDSSHNNNNIIIKSYDTFIVIEYKKLINIH